MTLPSSVIALKMVSPAQNLFSVRCIFLAQTGFLT